MEANIMSNGYLLRSIGTCLGSYVLTSRRDVLSNRESSGQLHVVYIIPPKTEVHDSYGLINQSHTNHNHMPSPS